jgi:hypothetical protein
MESSSRLAGVLCGLDKSILIIMLWVLSSFPIICVR